MAAQPRDRYLSLDADAPPGFEFVAAPSRRQLRGGVIALWTREPAALGRELGPLLAKINGVLLCPGQAGQRTQLGPRLWRLEVSEAAIPLLTELADAYLQPHEGALELDEQLRRCRLELGREREDRALLVEKLDVETRSLRAQLAARTAWTAMAMAALVEFTAEGLEQVETHELPRSIVDFLVSEPLSLAGAGMWLTQGQDWVLQAQAGELGELELTAPGEAIGVVQGRANSLLACYPLEFADGIERECLIAVERPGKLDEADASFLSLFTLQIVSTYRSRALHEALALASMRKDALIAELSTPIIQVWRDMVCLPIIGTVDNARGERIVAELLDAVAARDIRCVIVDFTGSATMDTQTVHHFTGLARAIGLLGASCVLTGISPAVARTLVELGVELMDIETMPSVQSALASRLLSRTPRAR